MRWFDVSRYKNVENSTFLSVELQHNNRVCMKVVAIKE